MIDDEIQKHYIFIKKERRLLCNIVYNKEKVYKEWCEHLQSLGYLVIFISISFIIVN